MISEHELKLGLRIYMDSLLCPAQSLLAHSLSDEGQSEDYLDRP